MSTQHSLPNGGATRDAMRQSHRSMPGGFMRNPQPGDFGSTQRSLPATVAGNARPTTPPDEAWQKANQLCKLVSIYGETGVQILERNDCGPLRASMARSSKLG